MEACLHFDRANRLYSPMLYEYHQGKKLNLD